jgi:cystathionine gamma-lyase
MSATATILSALLKAGDHVLSIDDVYGGTNRYFQKVLRPQGYAIDFADFHLPDEELHKKFLPNTKIVWIESPTNPTLKIVDIKRCADLAHAHNCVLVVDNTFMSPFFQHPLEFGADIVLHSVSKYINGHSDVIGGVLVFNSDELREKLAFIQNGMGAILSPFDSYMAMRGLKTLHVRMREHQHNAMRVAEWMEKQSGIEKVVYPGLASHPSHEIAKKQCSGFGGMITFYIKGGLQESRKFLEALKVISLAESLGGVESLIEHPVRAARCRYRCQVWLL